VFVDLAAPPLHRETEDVRVIEGQRQHPHLVHHVDWPVRPRPATARAHER
jgi:hypothetical protein